MTGPLKYRHAIPATADDLDDAATIRDAMAEPEEPQ